MKIIPLKYYEGGYMIQAFAFGGSRPKEACAPTVLYPSSLQNFLIDDGKDVILSDTGLPLEYKDAPKRAGRTLVNGQANCHVSRGPFQNGLQAGRYH